MIIKMPQVADHAQMKALWQLSFGDSMECIDTFFATGFAKERCRIAREDAVLGAAYWFDLFWQKKRYALLYAVAVDPARRGTGIGSQLLKGICEQLKAQGYAGAVLAPANESLYGYYERLGFAPFGAATVKQAQSDNTPLALKEVSWEEYLQGREGFAWDAAFGTFAQSQCRLYRGEGIWVMRYRQLPDVQEYLGPAEKLPGVLSALGINSARVRLSGGNTPAGMCCLFDNTAKLPPYLGPKLD